MRHFAINHCLDVVCEKFPGMVVLPLMMIVILNMLLRFYHKWGKSSALLDGAMSSVAPVKFFVVDRKHTKLFSIGKDGKGN